jgi:hypothetical protein
MRRRVPRALAVLACLALVVTAATTAAARSPFDGIWNVVFVTHQGYCDPTYRYGVRIANGHIVHDPTAAFAMAGRVAPNGTIRGSIRAGSESASAVGRLSRSSGSGVWRAPSRGCGGYWRARRLAPGF